jgi:hypothetical protein
MAERQVIEDFEDGENIELNTTGETGWIDGIHSYTVLNPTTGRNVSIIPGDIRNSTTQVRGQDGNLRVGGPVQFREGGNWATGTLIAKIYRVNMDDGRLEVMPHTLLRREAQAVQLQAQAAAQPAGVAFEVHTEFDNFKAKNFDKFMEIINRTTGTNTNFRNRDAPLQPLIDYVNASESFNENKESLTPQEKTEMIRKKADIIEKINRIFTQIQGYSKYNANVDNITNCIQYVLMQPPDFIDAYINTFVVDCFKAYTRGSPESCVKGMYERIYLSFRDTVSTLCLDQIQGISAASPLCKPDYIEIYDCFYDTMPQELLNDYLKEWYTERGDEELGKLSEEARIEDFVSFVRGRMNDATRFAKAEASIRRYANKEINILFGGKRLSGRQKRNNTKKRQAKRVRKTVKRRKTVKKRSGGKKQRGSKKQSVKKH